MRTFCMRLSIITVAVGLCLASGCSKQQFSREWNYGAKYDVTLYSATGVPIGHWITTGKIESEQHSDGWYFTDSKTGHLVIAQGTMVIDQLQ